VLVSESGEGKSVREFWRRTSTVFVFLVTFVAALVVFAQLGIMWAVLPIAGLAFLVGAAPRAWRWIQEIRKAVRQYPKLVERVADAESEAKELKVDLAVATKRVSEARTEGILEGWSDLGGRILATQVEVPRLTVVSVHDGEIKMVGEGSGSTRPGARFGLELSGTGQLMGVMKIVAVDAANRCEMECVAALDREFWEDLARRGAHEVDPPAGVGLRRLGIAEGTVAGASAEGVI
jgi:hypothetical protein